jgi:hypothetical protein
MNFTNLLSLEEIILLFSITLLHSNHPRHVRIQGVNFLSQCFSVSSTPSFSNMLSKFLVDNNYSFLHLLIEFLSSTNFPPSSVDEIRNNCIICLISCLKNIEGFNPPMYFELFAHVWSKAGPLLTKEKLFELSKDFSDYISRLISTPPPSLQNVSSFRDKLEDVQTMLCKYNIELPVTSLAEEEVLFSKIIFTFLTPFYEEALNTSTSIWKNALDRLHGLISEIKNINFINRLFEELFNKKGSFCDPVFIILILENLISKISGLREYDLSAIRKSNTLLIILELAKILHSPYPNLNQMSSSYY